MKNNTKKITFLGIMACIAIILSYVEAVLPSIWAAVPGIKVGLPNIIIIFLLYRFSFKEAAVVSALRLCVVALLFGNLMTFVYSLAGAVLSIVVMVLLKKTRLFSEIGVSIAGGVSHNLGQILIAIIIMGTKEIAYYMIVLFVSGTLAGLFVGLLAVVLQRYMKNVKV